MALQMARPTKHPKSGVYRMRVAIPVSLRDTAERLYGVRAEFMANLGTKDPTEAKAKAPTACAELHAKLDAVRAAQRGDVASLTDRAVQALAGAWYRQETARWGDNAGLASNWEFRQEELDSQFDREDGYAEDYDVILSAEDRQDAAAQLAAFGHPADTQAVRRVALAIFHAKRALAAEMRRRADGDWSEDTILGTFPAPTNATRPAPVGGCSFEALVQAWGREEGHRMERPGMARAYYDRLRTIVRLRDFLGHDNATSVALADAVAYPRSSGQSGEGSTAAGRLTAEGITPRSVVQAELPPFAIATTAEDG